MAAAAPSSSSTLSPKSALLSLSRKTLTDPNLPSSLQFPQSHHPIAPIKSSSSDRMTSSPSSPSHSPISTSNLKLNLKHRLSTGHPLYGLFLLSDSPTLAEIAGLAGYDFVLVDLEHGPTDINSALPVLRALAATQTPAILRLPESSPVWAKKALDLGPSGLMFPMVDSSAAAEDAVSFCRYPPRGVRGAAHTVVRASGYGIDDGYLSRCEDDLLIMCQVLLTWITMRNENICLP